MYSQTSGSDATLRSNSSGRTRFFSRLVAGALTALLLVGSAGVAQAQSSTASWSAFLAERAALEPLVVTAPAESAYSHAENAIPPRPTVPVHEVENKVIEVEGNIDQSIEQDLERLTKATRPPIPTVEQHEVKNRLIDVEGNLKKSIEKDLERLEEATPPPMPKVEQHEVENKIIEVDGDLDGSIEEDLERLENGNWPASASAVQPRR